MEAQRARRTLVPAVYGGAVLFLLVLALFIRGFSQDVGDARVAGRYTLMPLFSSRSLGELTLSWNGLALHFSPSPSQGLAGFEHDSGESTIVLASGARLRLSPGTDAGGSLTISPVASAAASSAASSGSAKGPLVVTFTVAGVLADTPPGAALAWQSGGRTYLLTLPAAARLDSDARTISLPLDGSAWSAGLSVAGTPAVAAAPRAASPARAAAPSTRLPDEKAMPSPDQLQTAISAWLDTANAGWSVSRLSAADALWRMPDGSLGVSDDLGVALLAESVARGTWKTVVPLWADALAGQQARAASGAATATATSAFVGGTSEYVLAGAARAATLLDQVGGFLSSSDNALLRIPGLVPLLLDHGSPDALAAALTFMTGRNASSLDVPSAVGLLEALTDITRYGAPSDSVKRSLQEVIARKVLPSVRSTDAGLFLDAGGGVVDVAVSIRCGALLLRGGAVLSDTRSSAVGRGLLAAGLALADGNGTLPKSLRLASNRVAGRDGALPPEAVYALVPTGRLVPREIPLARQVAPGISLWTTANLVSADKTGSTVRIVLGYPAGVAHYFALQGVDTFSLVQMHGIPWHADPSYAKYSDGWAYDDAAKVFYGKLTGRSDREEIDITF